MTYNFLESLYNDILKMIGSLVVKREDIAKENETLASAKGFDTYYACLMGKQYYYTFTDFNIDILTKYLTPAEISQAKYDIATIDPTIRDQIVAAQTTYILENYTEKNDYYRTLNGTPPLGDLRYIYVTDQADIDPNTPIHKLSDLDIFHLEIRGKLAEIQAEYSTRYYLQYLGLNRIDIVTARMAKPFDILRLGAPSNSRTEEMFRGEYYKARRYVMASLYNRELFTTKTLYDPIMGIIMLSLAIRNTLVPSEYDYLNFEEIIDAILESYGLLKYFKNFPFTYKRRITLALDQLLMSKGTDGVLVDVCKIFSPKNNVTVNRYYLMKTYAKDSEGKLVMSDNPHENYDLNFVKADIQKHDINFTEENLIDYDSVTLNDYLWQLTAKEKEDMLTEDFNLMMTKYIDIEAAYDVTELAFEVCCFINLILHADENITKIRCTNMYATNGSSGLRTMVVMVLAGLARRASFDGNIIYSPEAMCDILRFNYGDISNTLKEIINKYELQIDVNDKVLGSYDVSLAGPSGYATTGNLLDIYSKNKQLYYAILAEMETCTDIRKYTALSNIKNLLFISSAEKEDFKKSDGTSANTYYDLLADINPVLAAKLDSCTEEYQLNNLILYLLEKLDDLFHTDQLDYLWLNTPSVYRTLLSKYLKQAINVFKASSVQLESINVFFYLGDHDPIRVIDHKLFNKNLYLTDHVYVTDSISTHKTIVLDDYILAMDKTYTNS